MGQDPGNIAENNYFGMQRGWNGSTTCPSNPAIPPNSTNACFSASTTWGQELGLALGATSPTTGITYLQALENSLASNPNNRAAMIQSIGNNGWNGNSAYGSTIANGIGILSLINCIQSM